MSELNNTSTNSNQDESEDSDDNLKIVLESPVRHFKSQINLTEAELEIIEPFEGKLEKALEEKAAQANLNAINVKTILRKVATNEHVVALIREAEETLEKDTYEPKLTRSKAKELSTNPIPRVPWITPTKKKSEVEVLFRGELQEDSSGDEYVPCEDESEDDKESTVVSDYDPPSIPDSTPPTPTKNIDSSTQTNWTEDGLFKIPETISESPKKAEEKTNIALRTRSKLCLSATPLEEIEEAFIPPDITTDMYDMDCDDDDWRDFLKKFTRPLDEVTKEDDDHDPEYNAEEVEEVDVEELRMDRGVKVTKKELNDLIAELFEFTDNFEMENRKKSVQIEADDTIGQSETIVEDSNANVTVVDEEIIIDAEQIPLLEQQLRQHVQILTQNFLLSYKHPEVDEYSNKFKEYLLNLKLLGLGKERSAFFIANLDEALRLVDFWETWFARNLKEVKEYKDFVKKDWDRSNIRFAFKNNGHIHIPQFPPFLMKTIADSRVFLYPDLLPQIAFKPLLNGCQSRKRNFIPSEINLIALGLEQFIPVAKEFRLNITRKGTVSLKAVSQYIQDYMMPHFPATKIYECIRRHSQTDAYCVGEPIRYFLKYGKVMDYMHYVFPMHILGVVPPRFRQKDELPLLWAEYIYPKPKSPPQKYQVILIENYQPGTGKLILPKTLVIPAPPPPKRRTYKKRQGITTNSKQTVQKIYSFNELERFIDVLRKPLNPDSIFACDHRFTDTHCDNLILNMLPSMPCLASSLSFNECSNQVSEDLQTENSDSILENESEINCNLEVQDSNEDDCFGPISYQNDKDNPDDINALMVASSNLKAVRTKPSGAEKKRAKIRREFMSNLLISTPDHPDVEKEKSENFALAYYDKMREVLQLDDYHKMMQVLNEHEGDAVELYRKIEPILKDNYQQLCDEFLLFLREKEAAAIGKLIPWIHMTVRSKFLRKLETYFKNQPIQLRRIYKSITELSQMPDVSMEKIKASLIPMLKGNSTLIDLLVQNFMCESPPASLLEGPYETIDLHKEMSRPDDEEIYETITIPENEDKYGGMNCTCQCHEIEDHEFKSRYRHCIPCGTRFMQGKVYIQSGRGLRPATISFPTSPNVDHNIRLNGKPSFQRKKRSETSPSKQGGPLSLKECIDEETDDDVDGKNKTKRKTPHKRKKQPDKQLKNNKHLQKKISSKKLLNCDQIKTEDNCPNVKLSVKRASASRKSRSKTKEDVSSSERDLKDVDGMDWEAGASTESGDQKTTSPEHNTAESESEFCEESSQDNCGSDSNSSVSSCNAHSQSDVNDEICWKREEDKIILETFKQENEKEEAFKIIAHQLKNRTVSQIRNRFQMLLNLIMEQIADRK